MRVLLGRGRNKFNSKLPKPANGLSYLRVGGRGRCLGAGKTQSHKNARNAAESPASSARFVGLFLRCAPFFDLSIIPELLT
jgi:hypothetical protein